MKLIDEKGRLFGKVNLFDLLVVLLLIVGIVGMSTRLIKPDPERTEMSTATFQVEIVSAQDYYLGAYQVGDTLYEGDMALGTITAVKETPCKALKVMPDGSTKLVERKMLSDIMLTFTTDRFNRSSGTHIDSAEWLAGTSHIISNGFATATVVVRNIQE